MIATLVLILANQIAQIWEIKSILENEFLRSQLTDDSALAIGT